MASSLISGGQVMSDLLTIREKGVLITLLEPQRKVGSVHHSISKVFKQLKTRYICVL